MVTVFTPVYNRKYMIGNLYQSLQKQTDKAFEWIIIDDGSTDGVYELLEGWQKAEPEFRIIIKKVINGGKHRAINIGVQMAASEAFFIVDSDDYLPSDSIEFINRHFNDIGEGFAGIAGLRYYYRNDMQIGDTPYFDTYIDATNLERGRYGLWGDKAEVYKTNVLKKYPFPEFENENFLSEEIVWNKIAKVGMKIRWYNKNLYYCEYLEDGLTSQGMDKLLKNPKGWAALISDAKEYGYWPDQQLLDAEFLFIEGLNERYSKEEICVLLRLSMHEYQNLYSRYEYILYTIKTAFKANRWESLALYGMGNYGKRLLIYLKQLDIPVQYIIDRNYKKINFTPSYDLQGNLPEVDSVCITLKKCSVELKAEIQKKLPTADIWYLNEVFGK